MVVIVIPLGLGGWVSHPLLGHTSFLVEINGKRILLDAGEGTYRALRRCGFEVTDIDLVLITHRHGDHILGLPTLALFSKLRGKVLRVYGPDDLDLNALFNILGITNYLPAIDYRPVAPSNEASLVLDEQGIRVFSVSADHTVKALAYRIEANDDCLTYSGDTRPSGNIARLARGCKALIHEVSGNPGLEGVTHEHGHSTTLDAVKVAREAGVKYLIPAHYYVESPIILMQEGLGLIIPLPCTPILL
ncbi:MBL fold metallo-hydrolase [Vulcanisaeta thermophila]|uniref:MBL fold metallo-hydrolase n=1 Tax=Vulcanisaeta thermophila TaxID=867917 RepID=UPI001EE2AE56|nr:MBL fold metallo-hydrolase [Vulcanisaeta thermophila]